MSLLADEALPSGNLLDSVAEFLVGQDWVFDRPHRDQLRVSVSGKQSTYHLTFFWQADLSALQFFCEYEFRFAANDMAAQALRAVNARMWLGHFDLLGPEGILTFRHTSLFRGRESDAAIEQIEDLVEIGLAECERHHGVFSLLNNPETLSPEALSLALSDEAGIA